MIDTVLPYQATIVCVVRLPGDDMPVVGYTKIRSTPSLRRRVQETAGAVHRLRLESAVVAIDAELYGLCGLSQVEQELPVYPIGVQWADLRSWHTMAFPEPTREHRLVVVANRVAFLQFRGSLHTFVSDYLPLSVFVHPEKRPHAPQYR